MPGCNIKKYIDNDLTDPLVCKWTNKGELTMPFPNLIEYLLTPVSEFGLKRYFTILNKPFESLMQCYKWFIQSSAKCTLSIIFECKCSSMIS